MCSCNCLLRWVFLELFDSFVTLLSKAVRKVPTTTIASETPYVLDSIHKLEHLSFAYQFCCLLPFKSFHLSCAPTFDFKGHEIGAKPLDMKRECGLEKSTVI